MSLVHLCDIWFCVHELFGQFGQRHGDKQDRSSDFYILLNRVWGRLNILFHILEERFWEVLPWNCYLRERKRNKYERE